ncbi:MAG: hypothetical protein DRJ52_06525 [Thermoprotei archaeon]|nr:MAG: hypothetical protein DRJ52_06525 [Thermoprotei archaeon]RLE98918.1 MAG: hypothetical protein DRJ63_06815 [Thermoprotei archaeon]
MLAFNSFEELLTYIDEEISETKKQIESLSDRYKELKIKAEKLKRLDEVFSKIIGSKSPAINEIDIAGLKVVVGARAIDELTVIEEVLRSLNDKLNSLSKVRKIIEYLARTTGGIEGFSLLVETFNGIPARILIKESI